MPAWLPSGYVSVTRIGGGSGGSIRNYGVYLLSEGIISVGGSGTISTATAGENLTLFANSMTLASSVSAHSSAVLTLTPYDSELLDFTGREVDGKVLLSWFTASEINHAGYQVQRSPDGLRWADLGFITGQGTTTQMQSYADTDEHPFTGLNYYRLRQTDFSGQAEFSKTVLVDVGSNKGQIHIYPNPATQTVNFSIHSNYTGAITLELFDLAGRKIKTRIISHEESLEPVELNILDLNPGI